VKNHLADIDVGAVRRFEEGWLRFLHSEHEDIFDELRDKQEFTPEIEAKLERAVREFKERFGG